MEQIAMSCVNFNDIKADFNSAQSCSSKVTNEKFDLKIGKFAGFRISVECDW